jgi:type 1 fimbriae regulatory protein FimE
MCRFTRLTNDGQDTRAVHHYLGHKIIQYTVRYTELSSERFKSFSVDSATILQRSLEIG